MDQQSTPFGDCAVWTLAGCSLDGIVYAASIDPIFLDLRLWAYSSAQGCWKLLVALDRISAPDDHHCLISAAYNERLGRVDVFLECRITSAFLFRFLTVPPARLECSVVAADNENIQFDGYSGPSMHYVGESLYIAGAKRESIRMRVFRIDLEYGDHRLPNSFVLTRVWTGMITRWFPYCATVGDNFIISTEGNLHIFTPAQQWTDPIVIQNPWPSCAQESTLYDRTIVCASPNSADRVWFVPFYNDIREVTISGAHNQSIEYRILKWASEDSLCDPGCLSGVAAASSTHFYWVHMSDTGRELRSKMFAPPSLQYVCLSKLCSSIPAFKECDREEEAIKLRIPILTWRRYCR